MWSGLTGIYLEEALTSVTFVPCKSHALQSKLHVEGMLQTTGSVTLML